MHLTNAVKCDRLYIKVIVSLSSDSKSITKRRTCQVEYKKLIENAKNDRMQIAVECTAQMLLKQDVNDLKMNDIAEQCELGVASLYRYFGTQASLVIKAGCMLWRSVRSLFDGVFECDWYKEKNGLEQLRELMKVFKVLYISHKDFLRFLDSFDRYIVSEKVADEDMEEYQNSVMDFYTLFEDAYSTGIKDGSLRAGIDFKTMYLSVTHALMLMSEKSARGDIFAGESESVESELDFIIEMAIRYIGSER